LTVIFSCTILRNKLQVLLCNTYETLYFVFLFRSGHSLRDQVTAINRANRENSRSPVPQSVSPIPPPTTILNPVGFPPSFPQHSHTSSEYSNNAIYVANNPPMTQSSTNHSYQNNNIANYGVSQTSTITIPSNSASFQNDIPNSHWNQQYQYQHPQQHNQTRTDYDYYYGNTANNDYTIYESTDFGGRRPSLALSDSGNDTEMRRSTLDTSDLLLEFGRRPSMVVDSYENTSSPFDQDYRNSVIMSDPSEATKIKQIFQSKPKLRGLTAQETRDLITSSIQTIEVPNGLVTSSTISNTDTTPTPPVPLRRRGSRRISGASTFRMGSSIMRDSTLRLSELSLLSGGFSNLSVQDFGYDDSFSCAV
jgi:hypothetical protein